MTPAVGEIRIFAGNFAPVGWLQCDGSLQPIAQYEVLYTLIGTTYGGNGQTTFALPDLRGRYLMNQGTGTGLTNRPLGSNGGTESVTLTQSNMGAHSHGFAASTVAANSHTPTGNYLAQPIDTTTPAATENIYLPGNIANTPIALDPSSISAAGGSQPHENRMPFVTVTYIIATEGVYPSFN